MNFLTSFKPVYWVAIFGILIFILMFYYPIIENKLDSISQKLFRSPLVIHYIFFPGTAIHELSHAIVCFFLGVRVYKIVLFHPKNNEDGSCRLGYVEHAKADPFRSTLIGIAPIIGCALVTYLTFVWATSGIKVFQPVTFSQILSAFQSLNFMSWKTYLFLYLSVACALAGEPSREDMKSIPWLIFILIIIGIIVYITKNAFIWHDLANYFLFFANFLSPLFMGVTFIMIFEAFILAFIHLFGMIFVR